MIKRIDNSAIVTFQPPEGGWTPKAILNLKQRIRWLRRHRYLYKGEARILYKKADRVKSWIKEKE
jgi:hypothetical protein